MDFTLPDNVEKCLQPGRQRGDAGPAATSWATSSSATTCANLLEGLAGNDTLTGGLGNDTIDGGVGIDRALYIDANGGTAAQYSIAFVGGSTYTVTKIATGEVDTLIGVESVQFTDTTVALDTSGGSPNNAPAGTDTTITTPEDTPYVLTAADFGFTDPADSPLAAGRAHHHAALRRHAQPERRGRLGRPVRLGVADINAGLLQFSPAPDANGTAYASFSFQVQDSGGTTHGGFDLDPTPNTLTFNVTPVNDEQVLAINTGETVNEGARHLLTAAMLSTTDVDTAPLNWSTRSPHWPATACCAWTASSWA